MQRKAHQCASVCLEREAIFGFVFRLMRGSFLMPVIRARKLYTSARIYEWKFGKGEWKLSFASPTGRVDFFGFVIIFEEKKN